MIELSNARPDPNRKTRVFYTYGKKATIEYNVNAVKISPIIETGYRTCANMETEVFYYNTFRMMNDK